MILSRGTMIDVVFDLIVCPATGTIRGLDTEVDLDLRDGMPHECVLGPDRPSSATYVLRRLDP